MEMRKSGKIAVGIIAALGTIGALHLFIFKDRAQAFQAAKNEFDAVRAEYAAQGSPPPIDDIHKFRYLTLKYELEYWQITRDLNVFLPAEFANPAAVDERFQQQMFWDVMRDLEKRRDDGDAGKGPKLTFLGDRGWGWAKGLPEQLVKQGVAVEDVMTEIRNEDRLLNSLDQTGQPYQYHLRIYDGLLKRVGMSQDIRTALKDRYGSVVAALYTMNRIDQVMKNLPADFFNASSSQAQNMREMYKLFRMEWPKDENGNNNYYNTAKQLRALVTMMETAKVQNIEAVSWVKLHEQRKTYWKERKIEDDKPPAAGAAGAAAAATDLSMYNAVPEMMGDPAMGGGSEFGGGEMGMGRFGAAVATPVPQGDMVGLALPIEMLVEGNNSAVMTFLYQLTNERAPFELDRLRLRSEATANAKVRALAFFNTISYPTFVGAMTQIDAEKKINELTRQLYELAIKPGAKEVALADGLIKEEGGKEVYVNPSPTPWPDAAAAAAPAPAAPAPAPPPAQP